MKFNISKTYAIVTPESATDGDFSETGFVFEDAEFTLTELKQLIKDEGFYRERNRGVPCSSWMESEPEEDYSDGSTTYHNLHVTKI